MAEKGSVARELVRRFREGKPGSPVKRMKESDFWWLNVDGDGSAVSHCPGCSQRDDGTAEDYATEKEEGFVRGISPSTESIDLHNKQSLGSMGALLNDSFSLDPQLNNCREKIMSDCERILKELGCVGTELEGDSTPSPFNTRNSGMCGKAVISPLSTSEDSLWMLHNDNARRSQGRESVYSEAYYDVGSHVYDASGENIASDVHSASSTGQNNLQGGVSCSEEAAEVQSHARQENDSSVLFISPASSIRSADFSRQRGLLAEGDCADHGECPMSLGLHGVILPEGAELAESSNIANSIRKTHQTCEILPADVASPLGRGNGACAAPTDWACVPLDEELVRPFLSDSVVSDLWARLQVVKKEIHDCRSPTAGQGVG